MAICIPASSRRRHWHEGCFVATVSCVPACAVDRAATMLQRIITSRTLSSISSSTSCDLAPFLTACGPLRQQHARPATAEEEVSERIQHHNRQPSLKNSHSRLEIDSWGAVSSIPGQDPVPHLRTITVEESGSTDRKGYVNHDGLRVDDGRYKAFLRDADAVVPSSRVYTDPLHLLAYGSDASFYRLLPKAVIKVHTEAEVVQLLRLAQRHHVPVTFRAAGTSLSGQAITDSILIKVGYVGKHFRDFTITPDGSKVTAGVGLLGGEVNKLLSDHAKRHKLPMTHTIGPDPASIDSAMIGGIVANNASGMCCGVANNTYNTLDHMRIVFADGTVLDTADKDSCERFKQSHSQLCDAVSQLAAEVQADQALAARIKHKFKIKNTVGYSLNALVDFPPSDPISIIKHLMVGSEGTLGFASNVTYKCVPQAPFSASAFVLFPDLKSACNAVLPLKQSKVAVAVELHDYSSLRLAESPLQNLVPQLTTAQEGAAALLIQVKAESAQDLADTIKKAQTVLSGSGAKFGGQPEKPLGVESYPFSTDPRVTKVYWDFRKGLVPIIGGSRSVGTSMLIEDVVCPVEHLAEMTADLIQLFKEHGYRDASAVGHALEGNLHLVFSQGFRTPEEVATFGSLMHGMAGIVVGKYDGSLKGEHGTGRNMAPFVEMEWGRKATDIMTRIKAAFDPNNLLNPGVILNQDPNAHMMFLKPSPPSASLIDNCMECGYCEAVCPSRDITITPRQRIQTYREITRIRALDNPTQEQKDRLKDMEDKWRYDGDSTCAADGMCAVRCPVNINTGEFTKQLRTAAIEGLDPGAGAASASTSSSWGSSLSLFAANHFKLISRGAPALLNTVDFFHGLLGPRVLEVVSGTLNKWTNHLVPQWNPYIPKGGARVKPGLQDSAPSKTLATPSARATQSGIPRQVVFLPTCVNRMMGAARGDTEYKGSTLDVFTRLANKAGYQVVVPQNIDRLCCGMMFDTRGAKRAAGLKVAESSTELLLASQMGKLPIVVDNSPCLAHFKANGMNQSELRFSMYEPVTFMKLFLAPYLDFEQKKDHVALHVPCTSKQAGLTDNFVQLAQNCSREVSLTDIPCCGMAGDRGMRFPELTAAACQHVNLHADVTDGYSNSRTCEIGVSSAANKHFRSLMYLVDECSTPKAAAVAAAGELPQQAVGQDGKGPSLGSVHERAGGVETRFSRP